MEDDIYRDFGRLVADELSALAPENESGLRPRESLADFIRAVFGLEPARHHMEWIRALEDESIRKLCIICPPGHAKTTIAGVAYPAWKLGRHPDRHFLYIGNTISQARKQSVAIRDLTQTDAYQRVFPVEPSKKGWAGDKWFLERPNIWDKDPTMLALGVDGPALGARADEIIFDDVCDLENMATEESRKKVRHKIVSVAFSRQSGSSQNTRMVAVMTRWHEDDLARLFEEQGFAIIWMPALGYWDIVRGPECGAADHSHPPRSLAEAEALAAAHPLDEGEPLWPEEYPREFLAGFMREPDTWTLEYQGLTFRPGGNKFRLEQFVPYGDGERKQLDPDSVRAVYQFWDTASKKSAEADFWAGMTWAWAADGYYLLEAVSRKAEFPEGVRLISECASKAYRIGDAEFFPRAVYIESTGTNNGSAVVQVLAESRIKAIEWRPVSSKVERAGKAMTWLDSKPVYFPTDPAAYDGWVETGAGRQPLTPRSFLAQFLSWPSGRHDDLVDALTMSLEQLIQHPVNASAERAALMASNTGLERRATRTSAPPVPVNIRRPARNIFAPRWKERRRRLYPAP